MAYRVNKSVSAGAIVAALAAGATLGLATTASSEPDAKRGLMPMPSATGGPDMSKVPDYIPAADPAGDKPVGWVRSADVLDSTAPVWTAAIGFVPRRMPVFADDLKTVVGHMIDGYGFVRLGDALPAPFSTTNSTQLAP